MHNPTAYRHSIPPRRRRLSEEVRAMSTTRRGLLTAGWVMPAAALGVATSQAPAPALAREESGRRLWPMTTAHADWEPTARVLGRPVSGRQLRPDTSHGLNKNQPPRRRIVPAVAGPPDPAVRNCWPTTNTRGVSIRTVDCCTSSACSTRRAGRRRAPPLRPHGRRHHRHHPAAGRTRTQPADHRRTQRRRRHRPGRETGQSRRGLHALQEEGEHAPHTQALLTSISARAHALIDLALAIVGSPLT
jgi:hypothetical protein